MSRNKIAAIVALVLSIVWACVFAFVHFMDDPADPSFLSSGTLTLIFTAAVPIFLIWLASASIATSIQTEDRLWKLEVEMGNIRAQLASSSKIRDMSPQPEGIVDAVFDTRPGADADDESAGGDQAAEADDQTGDGQPGAEEPITGIAPREEEDGISNSILIRALNFAEDNNDVMGIAAVDTAARIPEVANLLDSSMNILEIFAESGISVDNLHTTLSAPEAWREAEFAGRNNSVTDLSDLSEIHLAGSVRRIRNELPEFVEASQLFRERAAEFLSRFVRNADDNEIIGILNTRTYRSFLLLEHAAS